MARIEVLTGRERRRRWSEDQKRAVVRAAFAPGSVVSDVARRADVHPGQIYRWRRDLGGAARSGFAAVIVSPNEHQAPGRPGEAIELELSGARVRIPVSTSPALAASIVGALR